MKPNTFIVGSPRSGTTALHKYLDSHPEIYMSKFKEPHYFATDLKPSTPWEKKLRNKKNYFALFEEASDHKIVGESSVFYLYSKKSAINIKRYNKDAKIIISLRPPIEVINSFFWRRFLNGYENVESLEKALEIEPLRKKGKMLPEGIMTFKEGYYYRDLVTYGEQVERYVSNFPRSNIHVIDFVEFKKNPKKIYKKLLYFLEVSSDFLPDFKTVNSLKSPRNKYLASIISNPPSFIKKIAFMTYPHSKNFYNYIKKINTKNKKDEYIISQSVKEDLYDKLQPDIKRLSVLLDYDFTFWLDL